MKKKALAIVLSLCMVLGMIPVHMENSKSMAAEKDAEALSVDRSSNEAKAEARDVEVRYIDNDGNLFLSEEVSIPYGKWTYAVTPPEGYLLVDTNNIISIDDYTEKIDVVVKEKEKKSIVVKYETSTGIEKGRQRISVYADALEIKESALTQVPEGYEVVSIGAIENTTVHVVVEAIPTTKDVKVVYFYNDENVGDETVTVPVEATTVTEDQLNVPANYKFVKATTINSRDTVKVTVERKTVAVRVNYETSTGSGKGSERVTVDIEALEIKESDLKHVPEGYKVVSISPIENKTVTVVVEEIPTTKEVTVLYFCDDVPISTEKVNVPEDAIKVTEDQLNIPEGYEFESSWGINQQNKVRVDLKEIIIYKNVTVKYFCDGEYLKGKDQVVKAEEDATRISQEDLEIPEGYEFASAYNISRQNKVRVNLNKVVKANDNSTVSVYSEREDDTQVTPAEVTPVEENTGILGFLRTFIRGLR